MFKPIRTFKYRIVIFSAILVILFATSLIVRAQLEPFITHLPIVSVPKDTTIFGVEVLYSLNLKLLSSAINSDTYWIRRNGLLWSDVQPNSPDEWNWDNSNVAKLEQDFIRASSNGIKVVLVVRGTPTWAQLYPGYSCGPIKQEMFPAFAHFMAEAVKRFSASPYNVMYYEIWNEPDVDHNIIGPDNEFGCWGDQGDTYYGGSYFASMLAQIFPAMKAANSNIKVVVGGFLLSCDPTQPGEEGNCDSEDKARPPRFFEGILKAGGGAFLDIVSFHAYPTYSSSSPNPIMNEVEYIKWKARGGVVQGKIDYLREVMSNYGVDKPIFHSEGGLIFSQGDVNEEAKADYLVWLYTRNLSEGLMGTIWYTLNGPGWRGGGLLDQNQDPLPAYNAYKFMVQELSDAEFSSKITDPNLPGVIEFIFERNDKNIHIYFSIDMNIHILAAPPGWTAIYDVYGNPITIPGATFTLQHPVYIETGQ